MEKKQLSWLESLELWRTISLPEVSEREMENILLVMILMKNIGQVSEQNITSTEAEDFLDCHRRRAWHEMPETTLKLKNYLKDADLPYGETERFEKLQRRREEMKWRRENMGDDTTEGVEAQ